MSQKRIVVVGSNFAGFTCASELKRALGDRHRVTVISKTHEFLFSPWLALLAFGKRTRAELTFSIRAPLEKHGLRFREEEVTRLDLERRRVLTRSGEERYDYLVIATGPKANYAAVPGLGPRGYTQSIVSIADAERAGAAFKRFLKAPGPVIVGEAPGASGFGASLDFLSNTAEQLAHHGLEVPLTWLTPEAVPLSDQIRGVESVMGAVIQRVSPEEISLADHRRLPFAYAMIIPPVLGVDVVRACESITNASGFVIVNDRLQCERYPEVFAAGSAAAVDPSIPKSGQVAEAMGKLVAQNIAAQLEGRAMASLSPPLAVPVAGDEARWATLAFETYFSDA